MRDPKEFPSSMRNLDHSAKGCEFKLNSVTIREVARAANVSIATVSRVVNGIPNRVSVKTTDKVLKAIKQLKYRPSHAGSTLRRGVSSSLAVLVPQISNTFNLAIATSIETALRRRGELMLLCGTDDSPTAQDYYIREMRAQAVFGIVLLGAVASEGLDEALAADVPLVFVNRRPPSRHVAPFVGIDNFRAAKEVGRFFRVKHPAKIVIIHTPLDSSAVSERVNGFINGLNDAEFGTSPVLIGVRSHAKEEAYQVAMDLLGVSSTGLAIFCSTDEIAYGVARRCMELNLGIQKDVLLFGFDGNPLNRYLAPWLGTVEVPYEDFGEAVRDILEDYRHARNGGDPHEVLFPYEVYIPSSLYR